MRRGRLACRARPRPAPPRDVALRARARPLPVLIVPRAAVGGGDGTDGGDMAVRQLVVLALALLSAEGGSGAGEGPARRGWRLSRGSGGPPGGPAGGVPKPRRPGNARGPRAGLTPG